MSGWAVMAPVSGKPGGSDAPTSPRHLGRQGLPAREADRRLSWCGHGVHAAGGAAELDHRRRAGRGGVLRRKLGAACGAGEGMGAIGAGAAAGANMGAERTGSARGHGHHAGSGHAGHPARSGRGGRERIGQLVHRPVAAAAGRRTAVAGRTPGRCAVAGRTAVAGRAGGGCWGGAPPRFLPPPPPPRISTRTSRTMTTTSPPMPAMSGHDSGFLVALSVSTRLVVDRRGAVGLVVVDDQARHHVVARAVEHLVVVGDGERHVAVAGAAVALPTMCSGLQLLHRLLRELGVAAARRWPEACVPAGMKYASARCLSPAQQKSPYTVNCPPG